MTHNRSDACSGICTVAESVRQVEHSLRVIANFPPDAEADETTIVDVDGTARIIDPQDDFRLARHHRYGCSFDAAVCAYIHRAYVYQAQVLWCKSLTFDICAVIYVVRS